MPILNIQRRHAELGRIRLGNKGAKGQPQKLDTFRFTSPNQRHIEDIAKLYGGQARQWQNGNRQEWEVYTTAKSVPVIVVKGGLSQWYELWSGGGCQRRCDGEREHISDSPCICATEQRDQVCKPTTRLSVMLRQLDAIGVWRLESHGWNSAAELPGLVELAMHVGDLVPANLYLAERVKIADGRTSRFVVPGLDLEVAPGRLAEIVSGQASAAAIAGAAPAQIESGRPDYTALLDGAATPEDCQTIWHQAGQAGHLDEALKAAINDRARQLKPTEPATTAADDGGAGAAPEADVDAVWNTVVATAGQHGWTTTMLTGAFEQWAALPVGDADVAQMTEFLAALRRGDIDVPEVVA